MILVPANRVKMRRSLKGVATNKCSANNLTTAVLELAVELKSQRYFRKEFSLWKLSQLCDPLSLSLSLDNLDDIGVVSLKLIFIIACSVAVIYLQSVYQKVRKT